MVRQESPYADALRAVALAGLSVLLLSGCQTAKEAANCPVANILASTARLTKFKPNMDGDPAGELFTIQITGVKSGCSFDKDEGTTDASLDITFRATRPPTGAAANYTAPYFVAAVQNGSSVISKKVLGTAFTFQPGEASLTFTENVPSIVTKFANGTKPYEYGLLVGLQLTREQFEYNTRLDPLEP
ncbi:MAG TPA: hypothetical protein VMU08_15210 [Rhizomicrobium sp.]|nr:hypothetical protein [Rhizomicrobium sp.]